MTDTEKKPLPPKRKGLTRRQKRSLSRGVQYAVFAAAVIAFGVTADWGRLQNQFAQAEIAERMFPDVITLALKNTVLYTVTGFGVGLALGMVIALMRLSSVGPYRWLAKHLHRDLPRPARPADLHLHRRRRPARLPRHRDRRRDVRQGRPRARPGGRRLHGGDHPGLSIQAVPKGQMEAARSLGFSPGRAMVSIIIPQAFRIILPPLTNELVLLFKDSSLVLFLGVTLEERELSKYGRDLASQTANSTPILVAYLCYLLITIPLGFVVRRMEAKAQEAVR